MGYSPHDHKRVKHDLATKQQIKYMSKVIENYIVAKLYFNKNIDSLEMNVLHGKYLKNIVNK